MSPMQLLEYALDLQERIQYAGGLLGLAVLILIGVTLYDLSELVDDNHRNRRRKR